MRRIIYWCQSLDSFRQIRISDIMNHIDYYRWNCYNRSDRSKIWEDSYRDRYRDYDNRISIIWYMYRDWIDRIYHINSNIYRLRNR
jgi:hypothetical protein